MAKRSVSERVTQILLDNLGVAEEEVKPTASLVDDLGCDSLDIIEIVMACEEEFNIEIPDADVERIASVSELVAYLEPRV